MKNNKMHSEHYNIEYFNWQKNLGIFGGKANSFKFQKSVNSSDKVIDFGCGGGYLLKEIDAFEKIGIEPNKNAHAEIKNNASSVYSSTDEALNSLGDGYADVIISNNALEHCLNPYLELKNIYRLLKKGGVAHFLVPCDRHSYQWRENDRDYHLYSWSQMNIGNLFYEVGFRDLEVQSKNIKWPPKYLQIQKLLGWRLFNLVARLYGVFSKHWVQIEIVCKK